MLLGVWGEKNVPGVCWQRKLVQALWESVGSFLQKLNMALLCDLAFPILDVVLWESKSAHPETLEHV